MINYFNYIIKVSSLLVAVAILLPSCATIIGGTNYNAHVKVKNYPNAKITFYGNQQENGSATYKVPRVDANKFSFKVKEEGCDQQTFNFTQRSFRGGTLAVSIPSWTLTFSGFPIPIPLGLMVDLGGSTFWKPNVNEKFVSKTDFKNFNYIVDYKGCKTDKTKVINIIDGPYLEH